MCILLNDNLKKERLHISDIEKPYSRGADVKLIVVEFRLYDNISSAKEEKIGDYFSTSVKDLGILNKHLNKILLLINVTVTHYEDE